jgi:hypothetical protein
MSMPMKRLVLGAAVIAGTVVSTASAIELTIHPGVGIGKVRLGMTKAQAVRALGRDHFVNERQGAYTELAWDFGTWTVGFQRGRVVQVSTSLASQRTKKGVAPGRTTWRALMRAYPGGRCAYNGSSHPLVGRSGTGWSTSSATAAVRRRCSCSIHRTQVSSTEIRRSGRRR